MADNTITGFLPDIFDGLNVVSRELVGFTRSVNRSSKANRVAKNATVQVPVASAQTAGNITPSATGPDPAAQTHTLKPISITKFRNTGFHWSGEEEQGLRNAGNFEMTLSGQFAESFRTLTNEIETDMAGLFVNASRAVGVAGTTPFAANFGILADAGEILDHNGAPATDRHVVMNTLAKANLLKLTHLTSVNQAASEAMLRRGAISEVPLLGFDLHASGQIASHTKGTGTSYLINNGSGEAVGQTTLTLDTGSGTMVAGDVITHASDAANKYVVKTALAAGDVIIQEPGLLIAAADDDAVTIGAGYTANLAFHRGALVLATRLPFLPTGGDAATDRMVITDAMSGLSFDVAMYRQHRRVAWDIAIAWGFASVNQEHLAIVLG